MADEPIVVALNDYRGVRTQQRTRTSGSKVVNLRIEAEPIVATLDRKELSRLAAEAYVLDLREQIGGISFKASPATIAGRKSQRAAYDRGEPWATKQFAGGRMGPMPPNQTDRLYNNSRRLAEGITANWSPQEGAWIVRFPVNRFAPDFLARPGGQAVLDRLVDMVAALRNPITERVEEALELGLRQMHQKLQAEQSLERMRTAVNVVQFAARAFAA